jgi:hypothetical protein
MVVRIRIPACPEMLRANFSEGVTARGYLKKLSMKTEKPSSELSQNQ